MIRKRTINTDVERNIAIGAIVSDSFLHRIKRILQTEMQLLQVDYIRDVLAWCFEFHDEFNVAPKGTIQDIYALKTDGMKQHQANILHEFLSNISEQYVEEGESFNSEYHYAVAKEYLTGRALEDHGAKLQALVAVKKTDKAMQLHRNFLVKAADDIADCGEQIFSSESIRRFDSDMEENKLLRLSGPLGDMFGDFYRGWLLALVGPRKRGKTNLLFALAKEALFAELRGLKVFVGSFEMPMVDVRKRFYQLMTALPDSDCNDYTVPVFDCEDNVLKMCKQGNLWVRDDNEVCKQCLRYKRRTFKPILRRVPMLANNGLAMAEDNKPVLSSSEIERRLRNIKQLNNLYVKAYSPYAASINDIRADLDTLERQYGFVPDVIITDYADIILPDRSEGKLIGRDTHDSVWKAHKRLAKDRACLVITASQSNKKSEDRASVNVTDVSEDVRKIGHVDVAAMLNQTEEEKRKGMIRLSVGAHRHRKFDAKRQAVVLQALDFGQPMLECEWEWDVKSDSKDK